MDALLYNYVSF